MWEGSAFGCEDVDDVLSDLRQVENRQSKIQLIISCVLFAAFLVSIQPRNLLQNGIYSSELQNIQFPLFVLPPAINILEQPTLGIGGYIPATTRLSGKHGLLCTYLRPPQLVPCQQHITLLGQKPQHLLRIFLINPGLLELLLGIPQNLPHLNQFIGDFHIPPQHFESLLLQFFLLFLAFLPDVFGAGHAFIVFELATHGFELRVEAFQQEPLLFVVEALEGVMGFAHQLVYAFVLLRDRLVRVAEFGEWLGFVRRFGAGLGHALLVLDGNYGRCYQSKFKCSTSIQSRIIFKSRVMATEQVPNYESSDEEERQKVQRRAATSNNPGYVGTNLSGWSELMLKDELRRALREAGFEHPSEVQLEAIPYAVEGNDVLCQAKSGMGKTAVFVISILNQLKEKDGDFEKHSCIVTCHTRELAHQIHKDFKRLGKYFKKPQLRIGCYYGGTNVTDNVKQLQDKTLAPHIIIATPGRLLDLVKHKAIKLENCKNFVVDECDQVLGAAGMRADIQEVFIKTPHNKQVMMFSATMPEAIRTDCKKFMQNEVEIFVDENKLVLHGLTQYYVMLQEGKKFEKLCHLLDQLTINQIIIFVNRVDRATKLTELLTQKMFNPICIHARLKMEERIKNYDMFKSNQSKLLVATDLFGRGMDIERVNLVINYDFPQDRESYLHRVGRAGRFGTKGLAISFIKTDEEAPEPDHKTDKEVLQDVQNGFKIKIDELPKEIDTSNL